MKFRKKPVEIEAVCWDNTRSCERHLSEIGLKNSQLCDDGGLLIETLEGTMKASVGDWIIKGVAGEFYSCKPEIFVETYEPCST